MLQECLYPRARSFAPFIRRFWPDYFDQDLQFIRYLGAAKSVREARAESLTFQDQNRVAGGLLRRTLKLRVSAREVNTLARELFSALGELERVESKVVPAPGHMAQSQTS